MPVERALWLDVVRQAGGHHVRGGGSGGAALELVQLVEDGWVALRRVRVGGQATAQRVRAVPDVTVIRPQLCNNNNNNNIKNNNNTTAASTTGRWRHVPHIVPYIGGRCVGRCHEMARLVQFSAN